MEAETCKRELVIEIPPDVVQKESELIARQYARKARVPGFRPGHVPRELILRRFRDAIRDEVAQALLPKFFDNAVKEKKLPVVGGPDFEEVKFDDNQPLTCKASFEIYPAIELKDYKGIEVSEEQPPVSEVDVDQALEESRQAATTFEVVEDRPAADGDALGVSYEGRDVRPPRTTLLQVKEGIVRLGEAGTLPELGQNLRGVRPGDVREFEVKYAADFPQAKIAGKSVRFRVEVHSIKQKVVPPLDDELAKTVSNSSTLEELRVTLRERIEEQRQREAEAATKRKLVEILAEKMTFPVPEVLVKERLDHKLRSAAEQLLEQGVDPRHANVNWAKMRADLRPEAEKDARTSLILAKVAEAEGIEVSEEEIDEAIRQLAAGGNESAAALKTRLTRSGGLARLQSGRRNQKALDFIYRNARVVRQLSLL